MSKKLMTFQDWEFVPYEIALELKNVGFDYPCFGSWSNKDTFNFTTGGLMYKVWPCEEEFCIAPLWQQAFRWFRKRHKLIAMPHYVGGDWKIYDIIMYDDTTGDEIEEDGMVIHQYEDAEYECLKFLIEIVKKRNENNVR